MSVRARLSLLLTIALLASSCAFNARRTLVLWHTFDGVQERALLTLVDRWNADASHAVVIVPQHRSVRAQHAAFLADSAPHIAVVSPAQAAVYHQRGLLRPLDDFIQGADGFDAADRRDLFPFVFAAGRTVDGKLIGLPLGGAVRLMLVDADWLRDHNLQIPVDRRALQQVCDQAASTGACFVTRIDDVLIQEWLHGADAALLGPDGTPQLRSERVMQLLSELVEDGRTGTALATVSDAQVVAEFASGRAVVAFQWSTRLREVARAISAGAGHAWDVAPIPSDGGAPASLLRAPLLVVPHTNAADEAEAWRFVHWMLDAAQTAGWAAATDEFPARSSAITVLDPARTPRNYGAAVQRVGGAARVEPLLSSWPCVIDGLDRSALQLINAQSITDTLESAQRAMVDSLGASCALR